LVKDPGKIVHAYKEQYNAKKGRRKGDPYPEIIPTGDPPKSNVIYLN